MEFIYNDGGRKEAGYTGSAGDCVVRAIAIATEKPYQEVYDAINKTIHPENKIQLYQSRIKSSARNGVNRKYIHSYLKSLGWKWIPTMFIGKGCKVHLKKEELPSGRIICNLSKHIVAVIDGVIHDTYDCSREETRCVYGYFIKE